jgi:toxin ParE1/3/4
MSRKIIWDPRALDDLDDIIDYLAEHNQAAAASVQLKIQTTLERLAQFSIGRSSRVHGYREKSVTGTPYIIAYVVEDTTLVIIRIIHQRRDWPDDHWPQG